MGTRSAIRELSKYRQELFIYATAETLILEEKFLNAFRTEPKEARDHAFEAYELTYMERMGLALHQQEFLLCLTHIIRLLLALNELELGIE